MRFRPLLPLTLMLALAPLAAAAPPGPGAAEPSRPLAEPGRLVLPDFTGLARKAVQSVDVTLDPSMLRTASGFLGGRDDAELRSLVRGLRGIYVHSYRFAHAGAYSKADVEMIEARLARGHWHALVSVHDHKHGGKASDVEVYVCRVQGITQGMAILAAQPRQLTVVNIVGDIDLSTLAKLQGQFGVPKVGLGK